ncbi:ATP-binding protein [Mesorhizobium sp. INR15]|uniref:ATP-binding protein n=1 Tax=Mesorhizobium sp. INR15 TaxID=2654248 RepID=UPI001896565B|nr:ATP-binding protein [Mesorhizobium sp. INR15]QPC89765.1 hypothetical protein GA829_03700 [Mesorhizobium sp. INR15]
MTGSRAKGKATIPPGEGERRAMRGYVPQYELAARLIYKALAAGTLRWVGLADPKAGVFDDLLLGYEDSVVGYQVKSAKSPDTFRLRTLFFGAEELWPSIVSSWKKLRAEHSASRVELRFATDHFLDTTDNLNGTGQERVSSAAFQRANERYRDIWTLKQWRASPFAPFLTELYEASGLSEGEFSQLWRGLALITGGSARLLGLDPATTQDTSRQKALFALLPRLIAEAGSKRRWKTSELFRELGWRDPFGLRHEHVFPVDALAQSNPKTEADIYNALQAAGRGYVSLIGSPGSGKSTLLQASMVPVPNTLFVRYLAFVPNEGHGLGRAEATDFLQDIISQLKRQGLGHSLVTGEQLPELRAQFETTLREAGDRFKNSDIQTVVIVDGLDHIPREELPEHSLLSVLPLPHAVPDGVLFLLGTQKLDLKGIPPSVRDQADAVGRRIEIAPLSREAVHRIAHASRLSPDVDYDILWERSEGHPLSVRYLIEALLPVPNKDDRRNWLFDGPTFGGNAELFYDRAWREIEVEPNAQRAMSYLALIEGSLDPTQLDLLVGRAATDLTARAALHLLRKDKAGRWSLFHNSFRLYLLEKTNLRFGQKDEAELKRRYRDLAQMATNASVDDAQRWMELRYLARAEVDVAVLALAAPGWFRQQFVEGRNPGEIQADIRFALSAAQRLHDVGAVFTLILCRHEIEMRADTITVGGLIDAYIATGDLDKAMSLLESDYFSIPIDAPYKVIDALLEANRPEDARKLFEDSEPIEKLLGTEGISLARGDDDLFDWASRILIFREPRHLLGALARIQMSENSFRRGDAGALAEFKQEMLLLAACSKIDAAPDMDLQALCDSLEIQAIKLPVLQLRSAETAHAWDDLRLIRKRLIEASSATEGLSNAICSRAARLALAVNEIELGRLFFSQMVPPTLLNHRIDSVDGIVEATIDVFNYAAIEARLGPGIGLRRYPDSPLLAPYQRKLEAAGGLLGKGRAGHIKPPEIVWRSLQELLLVVGHGDGQRDHFDHERWELDKTLAIIPELVLRVAAAHGAEALKHTIVNIDSLLDNNPGRLRFPKFRRAFAVAAYNLEPNTQRASDRLPTLPSIEDHSSPHDYASEMCEHAVAQARIGDVTNARFTIAQMHDNSLGIARPPKKDAQYEMWRGIFEKANRADPECCEARVRFYTRLLDGMSKTEGRGAAGRMAAPIMQEAAAASPQLASAVFHALDEANVSNWSTLVTAVLRGILKKRCDLAPLVAVIFNHLVLPVLKEFDRDIYVEIFDAAPRLARQDTLDASVTRIEVDASAPLRVPFLEQMSELAQSHGLIFRPEILDRWRPLPHDVKEAENDSTIRNAFKHVATVEDFKRVLGQEAKIDGYYAGQALETVFEGGASYAGIKGILSYPEIRKSDRALLVAARSAARAGETDDARGYAVALQALAEKDGSWGSWQSGTKLRFYKLMVELEGDPARERAFDAFTYDLSRGREWSNSLIPDLADVFEVVASDANWPSFWDILADHQKEFRDYRIGLELVNQPDASVSEEDLIAFILTAAIDLMTNDFSRQVRYAAIDLCALANGGTIVVSLINRLWNKGGDLALEGVRIAWETRRAPAIEALIRADLHAWIESDDLAVMRYGIACAAELEIDVAPSARSLPAFYSLEIPETEAAHSFEPPAGFSSTAPGLWTEDPYSWTWPLEMALKSLSKATDFSIPLLRLRAADKMRRDGGRSLFGPEPVDAQHSQLTRLELRLMYRRLPIVAAFRAAREVGAELVRAGSFRMKELAAFLDRCGGPNLNFPSRPPVSRPATIPTPNLSKTIWPKDLAEWVGDSPAQPLWPEFSDGIVIAAVGAFTMSSLRRTLTEEHLFVRTDETFSETEFEDTISELPRGIVSGPFVIPLYGEPSKLGIAVIVPDRAGTFSDGSIALCPWIAQQVGLRVETKNPFSYLDELGAVAVRTLWWRDGGLYQRDIDGSGRGEGHLVIASRSAWTAIQPLISETAHVLRWRHATEEDRAESTQAKRLHWKLR